MLKLNLLYILGKDDTDSIETLLNKWISVKEVNMDPGNQKSEVLEISIIILKNKIF